MFGPNSVRLLCSMLVPVVRCWHLCHLGGSAAAARLARRETVINFQVVVGWPDRWACEDSSSRRRSVAATATTFVRDEDPEQLVETEKRPARNRRSRHVMFFYLFDEAERRAAPDRCRDS